MEPRKPKVKSQEHRGILISVMRDYIMRTSSVLYMLLLKGTEATQQ